MAKTVTFYVGISVLVIILGPTNICKNPHISHPRRYDMYRYIGTPRNKQHGIPVTLSVVLFAALYTIHKQVATADM